MISIQYIFQIFKKNLNFLMWWGFVITKIYFSKRKKRRWKINLFINFLKNEKIWILKMLYGKHLLDFWNTCTQIHIFVSSELATFFAIWNFVWHRCFVAVHLFNYIVTWIKTKLLHFGQKIHRKWINCYFYS